MVPSPGGGGGDAPRLPAPPAPARASPRSASNKVLPQTAAPGMGQPRPGLLQPIEDLDAPYDVLLRNCPQMPPPIKRLQDSQELHKQALQQRKRQLVPLRPRTLVSRDGARDRQEVRSREASTGASKNEAATQNEEKVNAEPPPPPKPSGILKRGSKPSTAMSASAPSIAAPTVITEEEALDKESEDFRNVSSVRSSASARIVVEDTEVRTIETDDHRRSSKDIKDRTRRASSEERNRRTSKESGTSETFESQEDRNQIASRRSSDDAQGDDDEVGIVCSRTSNELDVHEGQLFAESKWAKGGLLTLKKKVQERYGTPVPDTPLPGSYIAGHAGEPAPKKGLRSLEERKKRLQENTEKKALEKKKQVDLDLRRQEFNELPETEATALQQVFSRFDLDQSDTLDGPEIVEALRELGLRGTNTAEKREILRICNDAAREFNRSKYFSGKSDGGDEDKNEKDEGRTLNYGDYQQEPYIDGLVKPKCEQHVQLANTPPIDFLTFALRVVPRVRAKLTDLQGNELMRQFFLFDKIGSGRITPTQCLEIARVMGLDQRFMDQEFQNRGLQSTDGVTLEEFQLMVVRCREHLQRVVKKRERTIQKEMGIDEKTFQECRQDIVNLYDIFVRYRGNQGKLGRDNVMPVLREFGLQPKTNKDREELKAALNSMAEEDEEVDFTFLEFLELIQEIRAYHQAQNRSMQVARFERYDRDRTGLLSVSEISLLLVDVGCAPQTRREQEELAQLIQIVDVDGSGEIDFEEFQVLSQRIDEKLKSMRYEQEIEHAMTVGFTEAQLRDLRWVFDSLDADGSEKLSAQEVRAGLAKMDKKVSQHAFETAFNALDADGSGELDFLEFLDFMQLMRDGEGIFAEDSQKLQSRARFFDAQLLRRVLENFRLSKSYLNSLSREELVGIFCNLFEVDQNANLNVELNINSVGDLFRVAKKKAEQQNVES